jgi:predicted Fe-S protein YdhL (DUF1289 family)
MSDQEPQSPCISVCLLDQDDICTGCFRSAEEITDWFMSSAEQKREILTHCHERRAASFTILLK